MLFRVVFGKVAFVVDWLFMLLITLLFIVVNDVFLNFYINKMYLSRSGQEQVRR